MKYSKSDNVGLNRIIKNVDVEVTWGHVDDARANDCWVKSGGLVT